MISRDRLEKIREIILFVIKRILIGGVFLVSICMMSLLLTSSTANNKDIMRVSKISGIEVWHGLLEWNTGMVWDKIFDLYII